MAIVKQFGADGGSYETNDYPFILLNTLSKKVYGRCSTLEKAHKARLSTALLYPNDIGIMLYDERNNAFIDWRQEELSEFEEKKDAEVF